MNLNYDLAEAWLAKDVKKAVDYGKAAHSRAQELRNNGMLAQSSFIIAQAYNRTRGEERKEETWLKSALGYAKNANDGDLIIKVVDKLSRLAIKNDRKNGHRKAYQYTEDALEYGVFGAPSFVVDDHLYWGNDRLAFLEAYLLQD